jgi:outer membrane protein
MDKITLAHLKPLQKKCGQTIIIAAFIVALLSTTTCASGEKTIDFSNIDTGGKVSLSLRECMRIALNNNLDIKLARYSPQIGEKEILKEMAEFDPIASVQVTNQKSITSGTSFLSGAGYGDFFDRFPRWDDKLRLESLDFNAGVSKKLLTGGECNLALTNNRFETNSIFQFYDSTYQSDLVLSVQQPLLKGFGAEVTKSRIRVASNNQSISTYQLKRRLLDVVSEVQERYWDLSFSMENLHVQKESLNLAQDLLKRNTALVDVGKLASIEILQAEVGVASREEAVLMAESAVKDAEDELKRVLNLLGTDGESEQAIFPSDSPRLEEQEIRLQETIESAIKKRPECEQSQIELKNRNLALKVAKNNLLPLLNLEGSYGFNGIDDSYDGGIDELSTGDRYSWHLGVNFQFPLGNRKAKSEYLAKELEVKKAIVSLDQLKKKIMVEVKCAARAVQTNLKRGHSTQEARRLAEKRLEIEEERYDLGLATTTDLLDLQEDVAVAKGKEVRALIDYKKSLVRLERAEGTTLEANDIELER